jgi:hypothetical protein
LAELRSNGITHVVKGSMGLADAADDSLRMTMRDHRDLFAPVYRNRAFVLYRLRADTAAHRGP